MISLVIGVLLMVLTIVAYIQIITKAGYSPWWILLPLSLPVLWIISIAITFSGFSNVGTYGFFNVQGVADEAVVLGVVTFLDVIANFALLLVFAFSDWPVLQAARSRHMPRSGGGGPRLPQRPPGSPPPATAAPDLAGQPPGWHKSGAVGSGEQSYWDGSAWSARRRWSGGAWVDIPLAPVGPDESPPTE
jgi:hypothetical protein